MNYGVISKSLDDLSINLPNRRRLLTLAMPESLQ
jgi:hypothetical protein